MADVITRKAVAFIEQNKDKPFFLYFATHDIHVPRVPHPRFAGQTGMGPRGDVIVQFDWSAGEILNTLDRLKLADNTLVILSSDNGPVVEDGYADGAAANLNAHQPAGPLRGGKYSNFEGGVREPLIACWPGKIQPGVSRHVVCLIDLVATCAALTGQTLPADAAPDSFNVLPEILGTVTTPARDHLVENGAGIRKGSWKLIQPALRAKPPKPEPGDKLPKSVAKPPRRNDVALYNLADDLGETTNLAAQRPEVVEELSTLFGRIRQSGRSRP
jgi:arylsulfatase A-like enzyme